MAEAAAMSEPTMLERLPEKPVVRFRDELRRLVPEPTRIGLGVSGGSDSLALLLLAAAVRPGQIEAATVDHGLRDGSRAEAETVARLCEELGVPHRILTIDWPSPPTTALQEQSRIRRYGALAEWARERGLTVLMTAHHANDQAETFLMRLRRGVGLNGLAGMRPTVKLPGSDEALVRPLLDWRRDRLEKLCEIAGLTPARDPSNEDERFERVQIRKALDSIQSLIGPRAIAASAGHLADAEQALTWAAGQAWERAARVDGKRVSINPAGLPREIRRRLLSRAIHLLATEGRESALRGRQLDRVLLALRHGKTVTVKGVKCSGGDRWVFAEAPERRAKA